MATWVAALIERQRPHLPLWIPVLYAAGIGAYFAVPAEPETWMLAALGGVLALGVASLGRADATGRVLLILAILPAAGFGAAALRSMAVAAPVLPYETTVNIEGRVVGLDRSGGGHPRLLLDEVTVFGLESEETPARVRISLLAETSEDVLRPGSRIIGYARLSPPPAPAEPGGFDFRRLAWFERIGAVGYARTPVVPAYEPGRVGWGERVLAVRLALSGAVQEAMPGRVGGFASAILTGDRSGVDGAALADLRASNLAHLLAISGLHMGLLSGFVFALVRYGLAVVPAVALRWPTKKIAAVAALVAGAGYLLLSGANVATQRAFIMAAVVLVAVLLDRPAFTLRSVALAAMVVLLIRPESLTEAGFQMSFAATTALIAAFEGLRQWAWWRHTWSDPWRYVRPVIAVAVTSVVAGVATAPISAFHFNAMPQYGLIANVLAVPAMGLLVMPAAVVAALTAPLGLAAPALKLMELGIAYILEVAGFVAGLEGAVKPIPAGPTVSLALIAVGGLVLVLWIGRGRALGFVPMAVGFLIWSDVDRPDILISEDGRLFGIRTEAGRVLNSERGNGFAADAWLGNDGDAAVQAAAYARAAMNRGRGWAEYEIPGLGSLVYRGSRSPDAGAAETCHEAAILLAPSWRSTPTGRCLFIGAERLWRDGALAIRLADGRLQIEGAKARNRARPWTRDLRSGR